MLQPAGESLTQTSPRAFVRRLTSTEPPLLIQPTGWEVEDDELWEDLFDAISQEWKGNYGHIVGKAFSFDTWVEDFVSLGFNSLPLSSFERISRDLVQEFGRETIYGIMENETVGVIAELLLSGEVEYYSNMKTTPVSEGTVSGEQNQGSAEGDDGKGAEGGENTRPDTLSFNQRKTEKDDGEGSEEKHPHTIRTEDEDKKTLVYPVWLHELHELAQQKSIELVFSNSDITQPERERYLTPFIQWNDSISQPTTPAYHGCEIPPLALRRYLTSFLEKGVATSPDRRGYFSVTLAAYYTNSIAYARVWPVIKNNLRGWRKLESLPSPSILIVVSEPFISDVRGQDDNFTVTIIPQNRSNDAADYASATKTSKSQERLSLEGYPNISTCDFIISPLPKHTMNAMQNSASIGRVVTGHNDISSIAILTATTSRAVEYMTNHITKIIILGWGEGNLGASEKVDFGTAGIRDGMSQY